MQHMFEVGSSKISTGIQLWVKGWFGPSWRKLTIY